MYKTSVVATSWYFFFFSIYEIITYISDVMNWRCLWWWCRGFSVFKRNCSGLKARLKWSNTAKPQEKTTCVMYSVNLKYIKWHNIKDPKPSTSVVATFMVVFFSHFWKWLRIFLESWIGDVCGYGVAGFQYFWKYCNRLPVQYWVLS